ncbi:MAG: hypothetical protein ACPGC5_02725 [Flavobacteriaceae bacterium]
MKKQLLLTLILGFVCLMGTKATAQNFFDSTETVAIQLNYSNKELARKTNDTTFIETNMVYAHEGSQKSIPVRLRARGNFRRSRCYFPPVKMKIYKDDAKGTLFEGQKNMKLVLPCLLEKGNQDNILKEYLGYKIYETVSDHHFRTRPVDIDFKEQKKKKEVVHKLRGFLIEDDKKVAKRGGGKVFERYIHPLAMDADASITNALFQYMIGNTDFSVAYQHNGKLLYVDSKIIPLPYDFDMSGLVNPSYAVVNPTLGISDVRDRKYRGFKRDISDMEKVRQKYLSQKSNIMGIVDSFKDDFENSATFEDTREFVNSFFSILESDQEFKAQIIDQMRTK